MNLQRIGVGYILAVAAGGKSTILYFCHLKAGERSSFALLGKNKCFYANRSTVGFRSMKTCRVKLDKECKNMVLSDFYGPTPFQSVVYFSRATTCTDCKKASQFVSNWTKGANRGAVRFICPAPPQTFCILSIHDTIGLRQTERPHDHQTVQSFC